MHFIHRVFLVSAIVVAAPALALDVSQYVCTIGGVYENVSGQLIQRPGDNALGQQIYVNADTGEATGYFGTDGFKIEKFRRPDDNGLLTIETASGLEGDAANRLYIAEANPETKKHLFVYTKNWLIVSGECSVVRRHN